MARIDLLVDFDDAGEGDVQSIAFGGRYLMLCAGDFDGATVAVGMLGPDGSTYFDIPDSDLTASGTATLWLPPRAQLRGTVTGGTNPSGIYLSIYRIP
jgi:hypothetical protein